MIVLFKSHSQFLKGIVKVGGWVALCRIIQLGAGIWVTRILNPTEFAIMAVVLAIQGFSGQILKFNLSAELVRAEKVNPQDLNVAWTYGLLRNLGLFAFLFCLAPVFAGWMDRMEAIAPLRVLSFGVVFDGLRNPRLLELRRAGKFGLLGWIEAVPVAAYGIFCVVFVHFEPSFWALVWAGLGSSLVGVIASYSTLPWKPKLDFDLVVARPLMSFGVILLVSSILYGLRQHGVVFVFGYLGYADELGFYNRAMAFSWTLSITVIGIYWKVAYPLFSREEHCGSNCFRRASQQQFALLLLGLPLALLLGNFGNIFVPWVLGDVWRPIIPLWRWLLLASVVALSNAPFEAAFQATRHERVALLIYFIVTVLQLGLAVLLIPSYGLVAPGIAAVAALSCSLIMFRIAAVFLSRDKLRRKDGLGRLPQV